MSINLEKRTEKVSIILQKQNITKIPPVRVGLVIDSSGSARDMFRSGVIQDTVDRLLAVAVKFDDDGSLDMWHFNTIFDALPSAQSADEGSYVTRNILQNHSVSSRLWGGTEYAPVMDGVIKHYYPPEKKGIFGFGKKAESKSSDPAMCFFITDGANSDRAAAAKIMRDAQQHNVYWQLIGVGPASNFGFLKEMADELPNVGFINLNSLSITDDELYAELISQEFCEWIKKS